MGSRGHGLFALFAVAVLITFGCTDAEKGPDVAIVSSSAAQATTTEEPRVCDQVALKITVEPSVAPPGSLLYLVWDDGDRGTAVSLDDGPDIWIMDVSFEQTGMQTVPLGSPGTFPPAELVLSDEGFVRLPESLKDGCYIICDDPGECGSVIVSSDAEPGDFSQLTGIGDLESVANGLWLAVEVVGEVSFDDLLSLEPVVMRIEDGWRDVNTSCNIISLDIDATGVIRYAGETERGCGDALQASYLRFRHAIDGARLTVTNDELVAIKGDTVIVFERLPEDS